MNYSFKVFLELTEPFPAFDSYKNDKQRKPAD